MPNKYASGKYAIAECDRCGQRYKLLQLKTQTLKTKPWRIKVCPTCWDPDHPQLQLGLYPVNDPQAVREPRKDLSYYTQTPGFVTGSRETQWGWNPVGGSSFFDVELTPNYLVATTSVGTVTVS